MSGRPVGAPALLLVLRHSCCVSMHVLIGARALLLREQARPDWCSGTPAGATTLLLREQARPVGAPALLLVLRHSCFVLYLRVLIILRPT